MILVVSAMPEELAPLAARLAERRRGPAPRTVAGRLGGESALLAWTGPGRARGRAGLRELHREVRESRLSLLVGVAGGLDPALRHGDVVRVERVLRIGTDGAVTAPEHRLAGGGGGLAVTVDGIVASVGEKSALWERLGRPDSAVVDMETCHWLAELAELADAGAGDPVAAPAVLRAVSDPAQLSLPSFLARCVGPGGELSRTRVAAGALLRPWSAPALLRLRRDTARAALRLADAVEAAVRERSAA